MSVRHIWQGQGWGQAGRDWHKGSRGQATLLALTAPGARGLRRQEPAGRRSLWDSPLPSPLRLTQPSLRRGIQHQCPFPGIPRLDHKNMPGPHMWAPLANSLQQPHPTGLKVINATLSGMGEAWGSLSCSARLLVRRSVSPVEVQGPRVVTTAAAVERTVFGDEGFLF